MANKYRGYPLEMRKNMARYVARKGRIPDNLGHALAEGGVTETQAHKIIDTYANSRYVIESHYKWSFKSGARYAYKERCESLRIMKETMDRLMQGAKAGEMAVITAGTGIGKSIMVNK